jgi:mRNA-degrading endonuclease RelE of RelBE toxin-antitoxin system
MAIKYSDAFKRQVRRLSRRYRRIRSDLQPLIVRLEAGERPGDRIQMPGHVLYKVRVKNTDAASGKRGGYRVIYYLMTSADLLLVAIYSKSEQSDIEADQLRQIIDDEV